MENVFRKGLKSPEEKQLEKQSMTKAEQALLDSKTATDLSDSMRGLTDLADENPLLFATTMCLMFEKAMQCILLEAKAKDLEDSEDRDGLYNRLVESGLEIGASIAKHAGALGYSVMQERNGENEIGKAVIEEKFGDIEAIKKLIREVTKSDDKPSSSSPWGGG